jgi:hypothetical protein
MKRSEAGATSVFDKFVVRPCDSTTQSRVIGLGTVRPAGLLAHMDRYFFDYRTNGSLAVNEERHDFLDLDAAHKEAFAALAESIRDNVRSAAAPINIWSSRFVTRAARCWRSARCSDRKY